MIALLITTIFLSLTNSTLVFAEEYSGVKVDSQKKEIDNIVEGEDSSLEDLIDYKIGEKGLSEIQIKDLLEYKSKASDELKERLEEESEKKKTFAIFFLSFFFVIVLFSTLKL